MILLINGLTPLLYLISSALHHNQTMQPSFFKLSISPFCPPPEVFLLAKLVTDNWSKWSHFIPTICLGLENEVVTDCSLPAT